VASVSCNTAPFSYRTYVVEPSVRAEIVDHIPHISDYCYSHSSEVPGLTEALSSAILPSLVRCLHDNDNQVRPPPTVAHPQSIALRLSYMQCCYLIVL